MCITDCSQFVVYSNKLLPELIDVLTTLEGDVATADSG